MADIDIHEEFDEQAFADATSGTPEPAELEQEQQAAAPEEGQEAEEQAAASDEKPPEGYVKHEALHAEREMRKELKAELAETREQMGKLMYLKEELEKMREQQAKADGETSAQAEQEALEKEFEEDPIGALRKQNDALQERLDAKDGEVTEQRAQQEQFNQFMSTVNEKVTEFTKDNADYPQAFKFLMEQRSAEFKAFGMSEQEVAQAIDREAIGIAQGALARGRNPAAVAYEMAKSRGYTYKEPGKDQDEGQESLKQTMDRLDKGGKAAATNQGGNAGGAADGMPSLSEISKMGNKDFDDLWDQMETAAYGSNGIM